MEQINIDSNKLEDFSNLREEAINAVNSLDIRNTDYINEIKVIIESNNALENALSQYSHSEYDALADFKMRPWGHKNLEYRSMKNIAEITAKNLEYKPSMNAINASILGWQTRTNEIKEQLENFSGDEKQAFDLIQSIHKEKILDPLNKDEEPILEKI